MAKKQIGTLHFRAGFFRIFIRWDWPFRIVDRNASGVVECFLPAFCFYCCCLFFAVAFRMETGKIPTSKTDYVHKCHFLFDLSFALQRGFAAYETLFSDSATRHNGVIWVYSGLYCCDNLFELPAAPFL